MTRLLSTLIAVGIFIALFVLLTVIGVTLGNLGQYELLVVALISLGGAYLAYRRLVRSTNTE